MKAPCYIDLQQARGVLADMGIEVNERQMRRAAEPDVGGRRKLPFFLDPIDGRLKIEKTTLIRLYTQRQREAEASCQLDFEP